MIEVGGKERELALFLKLLCDLLCVCFVAEIENGNGNAEE